MRLGQLLMMLVAMVFLSGCAGSKPWRYVKDVGGVSGDHSSLAEQGISPLIEEIITPENQSNGSVRKLPGQTRGRGVYEVDSMSLIPVVISDRGYTRFELEDERIEDVFVYPQEELQVSIHRQGYVLVLPKVASVANGEGNISGIYMTITGDEGTTQDISLRLTGSTPQPVKFVKVNWE